MVDDLLPGYQDQYPPVAAWGPADESVVRREWAQTLKFGAPAALYVHLPFCRKICSFCGIIYRKTLSGGSESDSYLSALLEEARLWSSLFRYTKFESVFLGGGTPTLLNAGQLDRLMRGLSSSLRLGGRLGVEANPDSLDGDRLDALAGFGLDYVSLGVQSLDDAVLARVGRPHTAAQAASSYRLVREKTRASVNVDLIAGLEGQNREGFLSDVAAASAWNPDSIHLSYFKPTRFTASSKKAGHGACPEETRTWRRWVDEGFDLAARAGYRRASEFSAVLSAGRAWSSGPLSAAISTLGLGVGAFSSGGRGFRSQNAQTISAYRRRLGEGKLPVERASVATPRQQGIQFLLSSWRSRGFVDRSEFRREFSETLESVFGGQLSALEACGVIESERGSYRILSHPESEFRLARAFYEDEVVDRLAAACG